MAVTIAEVKANLRVLDNAEDAYIASLIAMATAHCEDHCRRTFPDTEDNPMPEPVRFAIVLLASHFYENRANEEKHVWLSVEMAVNRLLGPYEDETKIL